MKWADWPRLRRQCSETRGERGKHVNHIHSQIELIIVDWLAGGRNPTGDRLKARGGAGNDGQETKVVSRTRDRNMAELRASGGRAKADSLCPPRWTYFLFSLLQPDAAAISSQVCRFVFQPPRIRLVHFHSQTPIRRLGGGVWECGSVNRVLAWHAGSPEFDP